MSLHWYHTTAVLSDHPEKEAQLKDYIWWLYKHIIPEINLNYDGLDKKYEKNCFYYVFLIISTLRLPIVDIDNIISQIKLSIIDKSTSIWVHVWWWWCLNVNLVIGFGPCLALVLGSRAKPINSSLFATPHLPILSFYLPCAGILMFEHPHTVVEWSVFQDFH